MRSGRWYRSFLILLLLGIFIELGLLLSFLGEGRSRSGNIAVVEIRGPIDDARDAVGELKKYTKREAVKAIVLRIDTPGGAVGATQEIHDEVIKAKAKKPVVASMGDVAASGGYYVAAPASKIVADPGTITGSLGVIAHFFVVEDLLKRAHLRWDVVKSGKAKDVGSPLRSMTPEERKLMQEMTDDIHEQFLQAVAQGRGMKIEDVRKLADGRVYSGRQAKKAGLVDDLGGLEYAIDVAAKLAKIEDEPKVIYPERESFGWFRRFAEGKWETSTFRIEYRLHP